MKMKDFREELKNIRWVGRTDISEFFTIAIKLKKRREKRMYYNVNIEDKNIRVLDGKEFNEIFKLGEIVIDVSAGRFGRLKKMFGNQEWSQLQTKATEMLSAVDEDALACKNKKREKQIFEGHECFDIVFGFYKEICKDIEDHDGKLIVTDCYEGLTDLVDLLEIDLTYAIQNGVGFKRCKRCSNYFIRRGKKEYCSDTTTKCQRRMSKGQFNESVKKDEGLRLYEKAYQHIYYISRHANKKDKKRITKILEILHDYREQYKSGELNFEEFSEKIYEHEAKADNINKSEGRIQMKY